MKKYIFTVFAVAAVLSSCSKNLEFNEDINSEAKAITTIGASTEISTRAEVSSDGTKVLWQDGDQIGVLGTNVSSAAKNLPYTLDGVGGNTTGTFQNNSSVITTISAVMYPYQEKATWANGKLTCEIPPVQTVTKVGSFDKAAAIMYSIGNTTNAQLKFAVNFLKVTIKSEDEDKKIHSITISSESTQLSGRAEITTSGVAAVTDQSLKSVTLTAGKNKTFTAGDYYIAVMAGNIVTPTISIIRYESGHTAKEYAKTGSGNLVFASGKNVKPISVTFSSVTSPTGHEAFQLWVNGPYWATFNVGVTDGKAESYGGYYCWGKTVDKDATGAHKSGSEPLSGADDTATNLWGSNWRMPTLAELEALLNTNNCTCTWTPNYNGTGVNGLLCTSNGAYTSNSVFLPAAGYCNDGVCSQGDSGVYWSSTPMTTSDAYYLSFLSLGQHVYGDDIRNSGQSVRAVLE